MHDAGRPVVEVLTGGRDEHVGEWKPSGGHPPSDRVGERGGLQRFLEHAAGVIVVPLCCGEERPDADERAEHQRRRRTGDCSFGVRQPPGRLVDEARTGQHHRADGPEDHRVDLTPRRVDVHRFCGLQRRERVADEPLDEGHDVPVGGVAGEPGTALRRVQHPLLVTQRQMSDGLTERDHAGPVPTQRSVRYRLEQGQHLPIVA